MQPITQQASIFKMGMDMMKQQQQHGFNQGLAF